MTTTDPLLYKHITHIIAKLPPFLPPLLIYYTTLAVHNQIVTRTWKERLFTTPWHPWKRYKLLSHPAIYSATIPSLSLLPVCRSTGRSTSPPISPQHRTFFIAHPALKNMIEQALKDQPQ